MTTVAALFVATGGPYYGLPGVDPWDEACDARQYDDILPVVAHPPCQRWGKFWAGQPLHIKRTGERKVTTADAFKPRSPLYVPWVVSWNTRKAPTHGHSSV